ncbi:hypothetical protein LCGC14_0773090 [marine sediment metagenome]|uniref:UDP-3-O-[3-hydroxymyristoyl] glucosamine N-acyltransferase non-repeat region domain-containing protein n=1 Tax=marine sediment metagenome TaxID=412755 RepID=A0A0F9SHP4_9ZZZZ
MQTGTLRPAPIDEASENSFSFYARDPDKAQEAIDTTKARVIFVSDKLDTETWLSVIHNDKMLIRVPDPKMEFMRACKGHEDIPEDERVILGKNVIVHTGTVIGEDGLGFVRDEKKNWVKFPHFGRVIIGDNVEIGANCVIDRGTLGDTVIGEGTKLENLIHVAHNAKIGKHCAIVAVTYIGGSSQIGDYTWVGPQVCIRDQIKIGKNCLIGMGAVVTKNIPDNWVVMGTPAKFVRYNE